MQLFIGNEEKLKTGWLFGIREEVRQHFVDRMVVRSKWKILDVSYVVTITLDALFRRLPYGLLVRDLLYMVNEQNPAEAEQALAEAVFGPQGRGRTFRDYITERLGTGEAVQLMEKIYARDDDPAEAIAKLSFRRRFSGSIPELIDEAHIMPSMRDEEIVRSLRKTALYETYAQGYSYGARRIIESLLVQRIRSWFGR